MKTQLDHLPALAIAEAWKTLLCTACDRIEIAGSIRREKETVGDIEIVCIPKYQRDMFQNPLIDTETALDHLLSLFEDEGFCRKEMGGHRYQRYIISEHELQLDLFCTTPEQWGVIFALRTGPAEFSKKLVTPHWQGGFLESGYSVREGRVWHGGLMAETPEEKDFFEYTKCGWIDPWSRR